MQKILIVDDDKEVREALSSILKAEGYETITAEDGRGALKEIKPYSPDLVLLDIKLPEMDGLKVLEDIKETDKDLVVIMITAYGNIKECVYAMKMGAFDYIAKPFNTQELLLVIRNALTTRYLSKEVERLKKRLLRKSSMGEIIGASPQMKKVFDQVRISAPTNFTVVIQGESGTGKELIARMIHQESLRKDKTFIVVDSGTLPESLFESELFGYEKGAFTGAAVRKEGKFELANGGTLFLDEITNLSLNLQAKLLRVIQEMKVQHLGGKKEIEIDVRIIVATNTILADELKKGKFRDDLYHRLNEFTISLPPLRERKDDISLLAKYFLEEANIELDKKIERISGRAIEFLLEYNYSGNVRELRNIIRRAVLLTDSNSIDEIHLPIYPNGVLQNLSAEVISDLNISDLDKDISLKEITDAAIRRIEKELIKKALTQAKNNKTMAAKILKIDRMTLYLKIKLLGLQ